MVEVEAGVGRTAGEGFGDERSGRGPFNRRRHRCAPQICALVLYLSPPCASAYRAADIKTRAAEELMVVLWGVVSLAFTYMKSVGEPYQSLPPYKPQCEYPADGNELQKGSNFGQSCITIKRS